MPAEITIPVQYAVIGVLGIIVFIFKIKTFWRWAGAALSWIWHHFIELVLVGLGLAIISSLAVPAYIEADARAKTEILEAKVAAKKSADLDRAIAEQDKQRAKDNKAREQTHLRAILPGRWLQLHKAIRRVSFYEAKFAVIDRFIEKYAEDEPKFPPEGLNKFLDAFSGRDDSASTRIKRAKDLLYPYMDFVGLVYEQQIDKALIPSTQPPEKQP